MSDTATAHGRAAQRLIDDRTSLARAVTDALYAEAGDRLARHGTRGRERCLEDMHFNVDHLIPAVDLGDADLFGRYLQWLDDLLRSRGVETRDVTRCLELLGDEVERRYAPDESRAIREILDASRRSLPRA
ncbi:MAG TPA: hypothetical protein VFY85_09620 [Gemmatimonadaceae bacterium]|nr:hypothetical protein [Gemmatimonadaceae bacterium]